MSGDREPETLEAVILAAGYGTRLGPSSAHRHKCLVHVGGRAILGRTLDTLVAAGLRRAVLVVGHLHQQVLAFASSWSHQLELSAVVNQEAAMTGTAFSLAMGLDATSTPSPVLVVEADVVFGLDALARLLEAPQDDVTLVAPFQPHLTGSAVLCDADRRVRDWLHETHQPTHFRRDRAFKTVNLTRLARSTADALRECTESCVSLRRDAPLEYAMRDLVRTHAWTVHAVDIADAAWFEVDTDGDRRLADALFQGRRTS